jgi:hypothetical protein
MRWLPLGGVLATLAIAFLWRPWLQRRRYGAPGILLFRSGVAALAPESLPLAQADRRAHATARLGLGTVLMLGRLVPGIGRFS